MSSESKYVRFTGLSRHNHHGLMADFMHVNGAGEMTERLSQDGALTLSYSVTKQSLPDRIALLKMQGIEPTESKKALARFDAC